MKKNGFVAAVTNSIKFFGTDESWATEYWMGSERPCDWDKSRKGPFLDAVHNGPEFAESIIFRMLQTGDIPKISEMDL